MITIITCGADQAREIEAVAKLDVRCVNNPHRDKRLRYLNGLHPDVQKDVLSTIVGENMVTALRDIVYAWIAAKKDATIVVYCHAGRHRSVAITEIAVKRTLSPFVEDKRLRIEHRSINGGGDSISH